MAYKVPMAKPRKNPQDITAVQAQQLSDEIKRTGFLLEEATADVFNSKNHYVEQNSLLFNEFAKSSSAERMIEVDVYAEQRSSSTGGARNCYVVECKGGQSSDRLILIPIKDGETQIPRLFIKGPSVTISNNDCFFAYRTDEPTQYPYLCHTGDFFKNSNGKFTKSSTQEDHSNLYKGLTQIHWAVDSVYKNNENVDQLQVFPMIVTNTEIHVAIYNIDTPEDLVTTKQVPWVAYRNPIIHKWKESHMGFVEWKSSEHQIAKQYTQPRRVPIVWIVNINSLAAFVTSTTKTYI